MKANNLKIHRQAAQISTQILKEMVAMVKPGVLPNEIDRLAGKLCQEHGVQPAFKGVKNGHWVYEYNSCISVNDEILHGIPDDRRALKTGDLVKLDFGIIYQGMYTDQCVTVGVGKVSAEDKKLLEVGKEAVLSAVKLAKTGNHTGDLGHMMHQTAYRAGFDVLKMYVGHGIGEYLHLDPEIPAYGQPGEGKELKDGMVICVECQVVTGSDETFVEKNGWTVKTVDGGKGVMFEYMVLVGSKPEILTPTIDWPLIV